MPRLKAVRGFVEQREGSWSNEQAAHEAVSDSQATLQAVRGLIER
jgi:hypothetical protein